MSKKISIQKTWRKIKIFMVWIQLHHFKNFVIFWVRVGLILVMVVGSFVIWFIEPTREIAPFLMVGTVIGSITFTVAGWKSIKRLHKKYVNYAKRLRSKIPIIRSMF